MRSRPKISVVVPVYNTAFFLEDCVESLLRQNLKGIEIILVDDGSTDGCPQIIESYTTDYDNVVSLHQENQGQGVARNLGLSIAQGEFIVFADSDDIVPSDAYEEMYFLAKKFQSDMVIGVHESFNEKKTWRNERVHKKFFKKVIVNTSIVQSPYLLEDISCCNRLIRRDLIEQHSLQFPNSFKEDVAFTIKLYLLSETITLLPKVVYHYRGRGGSDTDTINSNYFQEWIHLIEGLNEDFINSGRKQLFRVLLCSEMRKMVVQSRFKKIIRNLEYSERMEIFRLLSSFTQHLKKEDISQSGIFSLREQVRVFLLQEEEYACLEMFEKKPWNPAYLDFVSNAKSYQKISEPLLRIYMRKIGTLKRDRKLNIRVQFAKLLKLYEQLSKPLKLWRAAWKRKQKAKLPLLPLLFYFILYPVVRLQKSIFPDRQVWLIDERLSQSAEDNGFFLFKYLRAKYPEFKIYYVLSRGSSDWEKVVELGQVVPQFSITHAYFLLWAQVLLSTDRHSSIAYPSVVYRRMLKKTHNVFLQHGVMAVKHTVYSYKNYSYLTQVITSSLRERNLFVKDYGFPEKKIAVTGLARFDNLEIVRQPSATRQILVVPTWRLGLKSQNDVHSSKYLWSWLELLRSTLLAEVLEKYGATLIFRPHQNILPFLSDLTITNNNIVVQAEAEPSLSQLIQKSDLLITDYSSVMFDFFYQNKPAICYMFDRKEVACSQGGESHIDIETELPADAYSTASEVVKALEWYLENACIIRDKHVSRVKSFFQYRDGQNCERIFQAVRQAVGKN